MPALRFRLGRVVLNPSVAAGRTVAAHQDAVFSRPQAALRAFLSVVKGEVAPPGTPLTEALRADLEDLTAFLLAHTGAGGHIWSQNQ